MGCFKPSSSKLLAYAYMPSKVNFSKCGAPSHVKLICLQGFEFRSSCSLEWSVVNVIVHNLVYSVQNILFAAIQFSQQLASSTGGWVQTHKGPQSCWFCPSHQYCQWLGLFSGLGEEWQSRWWVQWPWSWGNRHKLASGGKLFCVRVVQWRFLCVPYQRFWAKRSWQAFTWWGSAVNACMKSLNAAMQWSIAPLLLRSGKDRLSRTNWTIVTMSKSAYILSFYRSSNCWVSQVEAWVPHQAEARHQEE